MAGAWGGVGGGVGAGFGGCAGAGAGVGAHLKQKSAPVQSKSFEHFVAGERFAHAAVCELPQ